MHGVSVESRELRYLCMYFTSYWVVCQVAVGLELLYEIDLWFLILLLFIIIISLVADESSVSFLFLLPTYVLSLG